MNKAMQRVVLVTGASSGIGRSCALFLSRQGYRVYGASRNAPQPAPEPSAIAFLPMDLSDDQSVAQAVATLLQREGRIDIVVNNAGFGIAGAIEDTTPEEAKAQFEVNFFGVLRVCRAALPIMRGQGSGYILNIGSIGGLIGIPFQGMYSASKFALEGFTESLRIEAKPFGIKVALIEPGDHRTAFTQNRRLTEASATNPAYRNRLDRAINHMADDEQAGPSPDNIARLVFKIATTPNPRLRYTIGPASQRAAVWLKRLLPYAITEKIMTLYYSR